MIEYKIPANCIIRIGRDADLLKNVLKFLEENTKIKWSNRSNPTNFDKDYHKNVTYLIIKDNILGYSNTEEFIKTTYPYNTFPLIVIPYVLNDLFYD